MIATSFIVGPCAALVIISESRNLVLYSFAWDRAYFAGIRRRGAMSVDIGNRIRGKICHERLQSLSLPLTRISNLSERVRDEKKKDRRAAVLQR